MAAEESLQLTECQVDNQFSVANSTELNEKPKSAGGRTIHTPRT